MPNPADTNQIKYNNPQYSDNQANGSSVGDQIRLDYYEKDALIDMAKEQYFSQLSGTQNMPKHMGKTIKKFHWIPLLDDRNVNDQGIDANGAAIANGNLYGSSKDVGTISGRMPTLTEVGGRVNRVGFTRKVIEGSLHKMGFFYEFTDEALNFDTEAELMQHLTRESLRGANELTEDQVQMELLNSAGVMVYTGGAIDKGSMTGDTGSVASVITYDDLQRLSITLDENRCPKSTKIISGSRMIDTRVIPSARVMFIGSELENQFRNLQDNFGNQAFIPVEKYANAGTLLNGEIGAISQFRIVVVPEMMHWMDAGATPVTGGDEFRQGSAGNYNVYPALVVGSEAFTHIGFQTGSGGDKKWKITTKTPGEATADRNDPYGETGFSSIKWYYGMLVERPEWIAILHSLAYL